MRKRKRKRRQLFWGADEKEGSEGAKTADPQLALEIRAKYASAQPFEYAEPMYNIPQDYVFTFENVGDDFWDREGDVWICFQVYTDSAFEDQVDIYFEEDIDTHTIKLYPGQVCHDKEEQSGLLEEGTWGSNSKFWLMQRQDLKTGEMLKKPIVMVFTIPRELDSPPLKQAVSGEGYYQLEWTPVDGADHYEVYGQSFQKFTQLYLTTEETCCDYRQFDTWNGLGSEEEEQDVGKAMEDDGNNTNVYLTGTELFCTIKKYRKKNSLQMRAGKAGKIPILCRNKE